MNYAWDINEMNRDNHKEMLATIYRMVHSGKHDFKDIMDKFSIKYMDVFNCYRKAEELMDKDEDFRDLVSKD